MPIKRLTATALGLWLAIGLSACNSTQTRSYATATWSPAQTIPTPEHLTDASNGPGSIVPMQLLTTPDGRRHLYYLREFERVGRTMWRHVKREPGAQGKWSQPGYHPSDFYSDVLVNDKWLVQIQAGGPMLSISYEALDAQHCQTTFQLLLSAEKYRFRGASQPIQDAKAFHFPKFFPMGKSFALVLLVQQERQPTHYSVILLTATKTTRPDAPEEKGALYWGPPETVARDLALATPTPIPAITLDNRVLVFYPDPAIGGIRMALGLVGKAGWTPSTVPTEADGERTVAIPLAVAAKESQVYLAYELINRRGTCTYRIAHSPDQGTTWRDMGKIVPGETIVDDLSHHVQLEMHHGVLAFARTADGGNWQTGQTRAEVYTSEDGGTTWQQHQPGNPKDRWQIHPILEFDPEGRLRVAYARLDAASDKMQIAIQELIPGPVQN